MIFGEFPLADAEGLLLAHSLRAGTVILKKGRRITGDDLSALRAARIETVFGARLSDDDVAEDEAAAQVAAMLGAPGIEARRAHAGRCNLHARARGLFDVDRRLIDRMNAVDEGVTVATLPRNTPVRAGAVVATVKIIPLAVDRRVVERCREAAGTGAAFELREYARKRAALIVTEHEGDPARNYISAVNSNRRRVEELGSHLGLVQRCPHRRAAIVQAIREAIVAGCDLLLISGATVSKDRLDVIPGAVNDAGGEIDRFGMPVEPGNMLLLAHIGDVPVIGLPGCARSRRPNGLDWVLQRLLTGSSTAGSDIGAMGVGGLIRSAPEAGDDEDATEPDAPRSVSGGRIGALVLAAGTSSRMGGTNKLLAEMDGIALVRRAVNAALASRCSSVQVVTGHQGDAIESALAGLDVRCLRNPAYASGMASSLRTGLHALPAEADAVVIVLGDMPQVSAALIDALITAWDPQDPRIVVPTRAGRRGNPILWPKAMVGEMASVEGDVGARALLERHADRVHRVEWKDDAIFTDVDTLQALDALGIR